MHRKIWDHYLHEHHGPVVYFGEWYIARFLMNSELLYSIFIMRQIFQCSNDLSPFLSLQYSSKLLWELRQDAATCLGLLCTVLSFEAESIFKWLFLKLTSSTRDEVKLLYLMATYHALETAGERKAFSHVMQVIIITTRFLFFFFPVMII